jgi:hypothetical protein
MSLCLRLFVASAILAAAALIASHQPGLGGFVLGVGAMLLILMIPTPAAPQRRQQDIEL